MRGAAALHVSLPGYPLPPVQVSIAAMISFTANTVSRPLDLRLPA